MFSRHNVTRKYFQSTIVCLFLQIGYHLRWKEVDPDNRDYNIQGEPQTDIEYLKKYVARHLPGLETEPSIVENCMYTVSTLMVSDGCLGHKRRKKKEKKKKEKKGLSQNFCLCVYIRSFKTFFNGSQSLGEPTTGLNICMHIMSLSRVQLQKKNKEKKRKRKKKNCWGSVDFVGLSMSTACWKNIMCQLEQRNTFYFDRSLHGWCSYSKLTFFVCKFVVLSLCKGFSNGDPQVKSGSPTLHIWPLGSFKIWRALLQDVLSPHRHVPPHLLSKGMLWMASDLWICFLLFIEEHIYFNFIKIWKGEKHKICIIYSSVTKLEALCVTYGCGLSMFCN